MQVGRVWEASNDATVGPDERLMAQSCRGTIRPANLRNRVVAGQVWGRGVCQERGAGGVKVAIRCVGPEHELTRARRPACGHDGRPISLGGQEKRGLGQVGRFWSRGRRYTPRPNKAKIDQL